MYKREYKFDKNSITLLPTSSFMLGEGECGMEAKVDFPPSNHVKVNNYTYQISPKMYAIINQIY
jgi:hypothetical protein